MDTDGNTQLCNGEIIPSNNNPTNSGCSYNAVMVSVGCGNNNISRSELSEYCNQNYNEDVSNNACEQIYDFENPYNCSKKEYNSLITSFSLAFSSSLLIYHLVLKMSLLIMMKYNASKL